MSVWAFAAYIYGKESPRRLDVTVIRDGKEKKLELTILYSEADILVEGSAKAGVASADGSWLPLASTGSRSVASILAGRSRKTARLLEWTPGTMTGSARDPAPQTENGAPVRGRPGVVAIRGFSGDPR